MFTYIIFFKIGGASTWSTETRYSYPHLTVWWGRGRFIRITPRGMLALYSPRYCSVMIPESGDWGKFDVPRFHFLQLDWEGQLESWKNSLRSISIWCLCSPRDFLKEWPKARRGLSEGKFEQGYNEEDQEALEPHLICNSYLSLREGVIQAYQNLQIN